MADPTVSIIMPAYNAAKWIARAVDSCLNQTVDAFELIIVDDGSDDETVAVVRQYRDNRIRLLSQENGGPSSARRAGVAKATGNYVAFLDADDRWMPEFLERTTRFLDSHPECGVCTTNVYWVRRSGERFIRHKEGAIVVGQEGVVNDFLAIRARDRCFPQISALVLRRHLVSRLGSWDPEVACGEEEELLLRWLPHTKLGYVDEPLACYFWTPGSFIKDVRRSTHAKAVLWEKMMPRDKELCAILPGYRRFRDNRMFRAAVISVAVGCLDDAKTISRIWPASPLSLHWWVGHSLVALPRSVLWLLHKSVCWMPAVKYRNSRGF